MPSKPMGYIYREGRDVLGEREDPGLYVYILGLVFARICGGLLGFSGDVFPIRSVGNTEYLFSTVYTIKNVCLKNKTRNFVSNQS